MKQSVPLILLVCGLAVDVSAFAADPDSRTFAMNVKPFLTNHCYDCHGDSDGEAGIDLSAFASTIATADQATGWLKVLDQLKADLMPPLDESRPAAHARGRAIGWIANAVLKAGHAAAYRRKMLLPAYGNYVDHELLFGGKIKAMPDTPARLWRTSPFVFEGMRRVGKIKGLQNPFTFSTPDTRLCFKRRLVSELGGRSSC